MKKYLLNITAILAAATVSACAVTATDGVMKPTEQRGGIMGLMKQDDLKVNSSGAFKGAEEVVIASFKVGFFTEKSSSAKAGSGFGGRSSANVELKGINNSLRQEIANAAYSDFVSAMKASGYKIADSSGLKANKSFSGAKTYDMPYEDGDITYFSPAAIGNKTHFFMGESPNFMGGFAFSNPSIGAAEYAAESGKKVISVIYVVDFVNSEGSGNSRWASGSSLSVGQGISVASGSKMMLIGGQQSSFSSANGDITLGQSVYSGKEFGTIKSTSSDAYKVAETALNLTSALLGGGTNQSRSFEIDANPGKYKAAAMEAIKDTNKAVAGKAASMR